MRREAARLARLAGERYRLRRLVARRFEQELETFLASLDDVAEDTAD